MRYVEPDALMMMLFLAAAVVALGFTFGPGVSAIGFGVLAVLSGFANYTAQAARKRRLR